MANSYGKPSFRHPFHVGVNHFVQPKYAHKDDGPVLEPARSVVELRMCRLSADLRAKHEWWLRYRDPETRARWEQEAYEQHYSQQQIAYVFDELDGYCALRDDATGIEVSCCDRAWQSDTLIPPDVNAALNAAVAPLEEAYVSARDRWDGHILNLVDPSRHPLVYDRTLVNLGFNTRKSAIRHAFRARFPELFRPLEETARRAPLESLVQPLKPPQLWTRRELANWIFGRTSKHVDEDEWIAWTISVLDVFENGAWSKTLPTLLYDGGPIEAVPPRASAVTSARFSLLPTEFQVGDSTVTVLGAISDVPSSCHRLVHAIEQVVAAFIPLFECVLTDLLPENALPPRVDNIPDIPSGRLPRLAPNRQVYERRISEWRRNPVPEPRQERVNIEARQAEYSLRGRRIQIIIKLTTIVMMPGAPDFPGRAWQVEGMKNEQIVACGFYYYSEDNITQGTKALRGAVLHPPNIAGMSTQAQAEIWGMMPDDLLVQDLGDVETPAGRCIAFPNVFQHNVYPCSLADESQPGYRKVLALFLVDPDVRIPSTSNTGVQDPEFIMDLLKQAGPASPLSKLPDELLAMIVSYYPFFTRREAEALRTELVEERQRCTFDMQDHTSRGFFGGRY